MSAVIPPINILKTCARELHADVLFINPHAKLSAAYESLAKEFGFRDWNALQAAAPAKGRTFTPNDLARGQIWFSYSNPYRTPESKPSPSDVGVGRRVRIVDVTAMLTETPEVYVSFERLDHTNEWECSAETFLKGAYLVDDAQAKPRGVRAGQVWMALRNPFRGLGRWEPMRWTIGHLYAVVRVDHETDQVFFAHSIADATFELAVDAFEKTFEPYEHPSPTNVLVDRLTSDEAAHLVHLVYDDAPWGELSGFTGETLMREQLIEVTVDAPDPDYAQVGLTSRGRDLVQMLRERGWIEDRKFGGQTQLLTIQPWQGATAQTR